MLEFILESPLNKKQAIQTSLPSTFGGLGTFNLKHFVLPLKPLHGVKCENL